ncbi:hypothetical protein V6N13_043250 [Hibiscus sabdariffa]
MRKMGIVELISVVVLLGGLCAESKYMVYNTSAGIDAGKINVHLVPHTHDDVGWLKTVDQYYVGSNNSIQGACVQNVLDSLVPALLADKNRKFIYVEQTFFQRWWRDQSELTQTIVKKLVSSGQLEFINGGMCMHDEAVPHYIDMIDQTTLGHRFLKEEFGVTPRIGWQIDPFGHSAVQAYLLGAEVGFDSVFFARIDYQDRIKRKKEKSLEVIWRGSKSLGSSAQIFAGAFPEHYEPPPGFYFEVNADSPVVQDNVDLFDYNVQDRVNDFVAAAIAQILSISMHIPGSGTWTSLFIMLIRMDVSMLSTLPHPYIQMLNMLQVNLGRSKLMTTFHRANAYWTGYYTSRPALKFYVRIMSGYYLAARQLEFFKGRSDSRPNTDALADALAIAQHHDAVTGTEKQHVANDYAKRLSIGYTEAEKVVASSLACLTDSKSSIGCGDSTTNLQQCPLLNITYCPASETDLSHGMNLIVVIYNSLGWKREDVVRFPVVNEDVAVRDSEGRKIESQLVPIVDAYVDLRNYYARAYLGSIPNAVPKFWLAFTVSVPALGFSTYTISTSKKPGAGSTKSSIYKFQMGEKPAIEVGEGDLKLTISASPGKIINYVNNRNLVEESVDQSFSFYTGYNGAKDKVPQNSGAYIFRPNGTYPIKAEQASVTVIKGPLIHEVHQQINTWIFQRIHTSFLLTKVMQTTRLYKEKEHVEVEFIVGPVPIDDGFGKEVATQITTSLESNKTFYTDSNGRDFVKRIRDFRTDWDLEVNQPVAGNYYPITLGIYIQDKEKEFSVLVDRSLAGSSVVDGQIELMLHRRLLLDDSRGVAEALNETVCVLDDCRGLAVQGKYYYRIDSLGEGAKWRRSFGQEIYSPLLLAFTEEDGDNWMSSHTPTFSGIDASYSLPDNVALITLQELEDGKVLLRLAHLYEIGEDSVLSVMTRVELKKLFPGKKIAKVTEMSLSANQVREEMEKKRLVWEVEGEDRNPKVARGSQVDPKRLEVELAPMEIRTFVIQFEVDLMTALLSKD